MTYVTYGERIGLAQGLHEGIAAILDIRFGAAGAALLPEVQQITDSDILRAIMERIKTATTIEEVRAIYTPGED